MTAKEYAEKWAGKWVYVKTGAALAGEKVYIVGYRSSFDVVIVHQKALSGSGSRKLLNSIVHDPVVWLVATSYTNGFMQYAPHMLADPSSNVTTDILIDDTKLKPSDFIGVPLFVSPMRKPISNYPHKCYHCGAASYNAMYGGKIDCSAKCKETTSA